MERDNLKAGLFVLCGAAALIVVTLVLADFHTLLEPRQDLQVIYRLSDGLQGLKSGAVVTLGGQPVGQVGSIEDVLSPADNQERVVGKLVRFQLPKRYCLYDNAQVELVVPTLGGGTSLNISSVGSGRRLRPSEPLRGALAGSVLTAGLLRDAGIQDLQRQQIRQIIANLQELSGTLSRDVPSMTASVNQLLNDAKPMVRDAQAVMAQLNEACASVNAVLAQIKERSPQWVQNIDRTSGAAASAAGRLDRLLADQDPALREILDNVRGATLNLRQVLAANGPVISRMLSSLELAAGQLKLASVEIRRSPWRLMYRPGDRELDSENLYDAARSFALAAGSLDSTAQSLSSLQKSGAADGEPLQRMLDHLQQLFGRYQQAEQRFWQALDQQASVQK